MRHWTYVELEPHFDEQGLGWAPQPPHSVVIRLDRIELGWLGNVLVVKAIANCDLCAFRTRHGPQGPDVEWYEVSNVQAWTLHGCV